MSLENYTSSEITGSKPLQSFAISTDDNFGLLSRRPSQSNHLPDVMLTKSEKRIIPDCDKFEFTKEWNGDKFDVSIIGKGCRPEPEGDDSDEEAEHKKQGAKKTRPEQK